MFLSSEIEVFPETEVPVCWNLLESTVQFVTIHSINKAIQRYRRRSIQHTAGLPHQAEQEGVQHRLKSLEQVGLGDRSWIP